VLIGLVVAVPDDDLIHIKEAKHRYGFSFYANNRETIMKKLSLFAVSVSGALVCAAVPASFNWSPAKVTLFSVDTAEARVGRPLTATSVAGVSRRVNRRAYRRAAVGAGVVAAGAVAAGAYVGAAASAAYYDTGPAVTYGGSGYGYGGYGPGPSSYVTVDPVTGRQCTIEPSGWHWCWRP
jgi:hypothetical protein